MPKRRHDIDDGEEEQELQIQLHHEDPYEVSEDAPEPFCEELIPSEVWTEIFERCPPTTLKALRSSCHRFASLLNDSLWRKRCMLHKVAMPPAYLSPVLEKQELPFDYLSLYHFDPLKSNLGRFCNSSATAVQESVLDCHMDARGKMIKEAVNVVGPMDSSSLRCTRRFELRFSDIGIPGWLMDVLRPRVSLTVHAYRLPATDGDILVSARLLRACHPDDLLPLSCPDCPRLDIHPIARALAHQLPEQRRCAHSMIGPSGVSRKEHQGWFLAGWQSPPYPMQEFVEMDFEVYNAGARMLVVEASCSGGGRLGEIEVRLHFPSDAPADFEKQLADVKMKWEHEMMREETQVIDVDAGDGPCDYTSECRIHIGIERAQSLEDCEIAVQQ